MSPSANTLGFKGLRYFAAITQLHHWHFEMNVTLSSAESELYAMVKCAAELIGIKSMMHDWGRDKSGTSYVDSNAALGIVFDFYCHTRLLPTPIAYRYRYHYSQHGRNQDIIVCHHHHA